MPRVFVVVIDLPTNTQSFVLGHSSVAWIFGCWIFSDLALQLSQVGSEHSVML